jgi:DUF1365 family protein
MNSCLYECTVFHRRMAPKRHEFLYRVFYFLLDLDELDELDQTMRLFRVNRPGLYSYRDSDHISQGAASARENVLRYLSEQGITAPVGRILLLTLPRLLGYVFNPVSVFFCFDTEGKPLAAVAEVGNTFGEWKPYLVPVTPEGTFHLRAVKHFYVSPFSDLDLEFDFRFDQPGERLRLLIDDYRGGEKELVSMLTGNRVPLTDAILLRFSLKYPLLTLKVILGIHWEALRIWLKGVAARRKEWQPELQKGVHRPHKSLANHPESCAHSCGKNNDPPLSNTP